MKTYAPVATLSLLIGGGMVGCGDPHEASARTADTTARQIVSDAAITAAINARLALDDSLSALKINVDTRQGRVALRGTALDAVAIARAEQLAAAVGGVTAVDNRLTAR